MEHGKLDEANQTDYTSLLRNKLGNASSNSSIRAMFKVPSSLKQVNSKSFLPHCVSIGPYNWPRRQHELQEMEHYKLPLLHQVIHRNSTKCTLEDCINLMRDQESKARKCYKVRQHINNQEFVEMLLLDSFSILECFGVFNTDINLEGHAVFVQYPVSPLIQRDLLMLENQLPLFVLIKLYAQIHGKSSKEEAFNELAELAMNFFNSVIPGFRLNKAWSSGRMKCWPLHLLGLVCWGLFPEVISFPCSKTGNKVHFLKSKFFKKEQLKDARGLEPEIMMHSVSKLRQAGIAFVKVDPQMKKLAEIEFNGKLFIPLLKINDATRFIFLNRMAYEQCHPYFTRFVTSYVSFMTTLINTSKDVEYLKDKGILAHDFRRNKEVANLFHDISKQIFLDPMDYYLYEVSYELSNRAKRKWRYWC